MKFSTLKFTEPEALMGTAMETARQMLGKTPLGLRLTKEALNLNSTAPSLEAAIELENRNQSLLVFTPEFEKTVQSFAKKSK
ncbi:MAG: enoyl-CoA hydratase/isomerase family protein, partial [Deltaproteobacteria bacterium]|nr:enoyl-CoA hydratase/isomerase family protein [Deltaproteobacteria bacterium]MBW1846945.1 hypothetical protein [Deltaproteobacteria bacterium]MBW2181455.1 hypothetical protein [Deltaproteobacteria bacterium]